MRTLKGIKFCGSFLSMSSATLWVTDSLDSFAFPVETLGWMLMMVSSKELAAFVWYLQRNCQRIHTSFITSKNVCLSTPSTFKGKTANKNQITTETRMLENNEIITWCLHCSSIQTLQDHRPKRDGPQKSCILPNFYMQEFCSLQLYLIMSFNKLLFNIT